jgi:hypothetical protein
MRMEFGSQQRSLAKAMLGYVLTQVLALLLKGLVVRWILKSHDSMQPKRPAW